jgi:hypothetical protein
MDDVQRESLTQSLQCADLLVADLSQARKAVGTTEPAMAMVLRDLLREAGVIKQRLAELEMGYR